MNGVLYIAHGSQKREKNQALGVFVHALHEQVGSHIPYRIAFLEHDEETIDKGASSMIQQGVTHVITVPLLLFAATHALRDIPNEIAEVKNKFPEIEFQFGDTFGHRAGTVQILEERIQQAIIQEGLTESKDGTACILIAHGTKRYPTPQQQLEEIADHLQEQLQIKIFPTNIRGREPFLPVTIEAMNAFQNVIILPFFMFNGHLVDEIHEKLKAATLHRFDQLIMTETLDFDERMIPDIVEVITESRNKECTL